jgi:hypothetical protein
MAMRTLMLTLSGTMALAVVFASCGVQPVAPPADPILGTWELNLAKSAFSPGPMPQSESRTYVMNGQQIKGTSTGVDNAGRPTAAAWTVNYDGQDSPISGAPDSETLSLKRIDAFTTEFTQKRAGTVVITGTRTVSRDGKVLTIMTTGTNASGQAINNLQVFDRKP